jgi:hypothetical protein
VLTVEGIKLEVLAGEGAGRQLKLDEVREIPLMRTVQAIGGVVGS